MLVIHENRGLNPYIEDVARRLAVGELHRVRARRADVGRRLSRATTRRARSKFREVNGPKMIEDFVASAHWLKARPECTGKIGAVGFCFGGGIVNQLAVRLARISAPARRSTAASPAPRTCRRSRRRCMLHYAAIDQGVNAGMAGRTRRR